VTDSPLQKVELAGPRTLESLQAWAKRNSQVIYLASILAASIMLRVGAAVYLGSTIENLPGAADQLSYHTLALRLLGGHGFTFGQPWWPATPAGAPTAHWSYLYTFYLAAVYGLFGPSPLIARLIQAVAIGFLQPYLIYRIGQAIFDERVALVSAALMAGYAYFIYYASTLMTESFYIVALLAAFYFAIHLARLATGAFSKTLALSVGLGLSAGVAALLRQPILLFLPFLFLWIGWASYKQSRLRPTLTGLTVAAGVIGALILPFTLYNYARFKQPVLLNTNVGFAFFWSNHPIYGDTFQPILLPENGTYGDLIPPELFRQHLNEAQLDRELLRRGIQFVLDDPGRYVRLSLSRIPVYFMFWPSPESSRVSNISRVVSFGWLWPLMLLGLVAACRRRLSLTSVEFLLLLFSLFYVTLHLLSWSLIRYRLPVDAIWLLFAGFALVTIATRLQRWRSGIWAMKS